MRLELAIGETFNIQTLKLNKKTDRQSTPRRIGRQTCRIMTKKNSVYSILYGKITEDGIVIIINTIHEHIPRNSVPVVVKYCTTAVPPLAVGRKVSDRRQWTARRVFPDEIISRTHDPEL